MRRQTMWIAAVAVAVGLLAGYSLAPRDTNTPPDRPVLRLIARAAKAFLWVAVFAEPSPVEASQPRQYLATEEPVIDHARGW